MPTNPQVVRVPQLTWVAIVPAACAERLTLSHAALGKEVASSRAKTFSQATKDSSEVQAAAGCKSWHRSAPPIAAGSGKQDGHKVQCA